MMLDKEKKEVFWGNKATYNFVLLQELVLREKLWTQDGIKHVS